MLVVVGLFGLGRVGLAADDFPRLELHNGVISVLLYLPDAVRGYYRGTRFDWSGIIEQRLENSCSNTIDIDYCNYNFTLIDGMPYGPDYRVEFAFSSAQPVPINGLAWFRGNAVEVDEPLGESMQWSGRYRFFAGTD